MNNGSVESVMITSLVMCKASGIKVDLQTSARYHKRYQTALQVQSCLASSQRSGLYIWAN